MRKLIEILAKIRRKWTKIRLQPIRVFCFHQVSDLFDANIMWECDWMHTEQFKKSILHLKEEYTFISLTEACAMMKSDRIRRKKYAVLTMDDASNCIIDLMPWLVEQHIPITLFIPPTFLRNEVSHKCGISITEEQLEQLLHDYKEYITIGGHSYAHMISTQMTIEEFTNDVQRTKARLDHYEGYIPYFAYPGGFHNRETDTVLDSLELVPVYCDSYMNYNNANHIHREILT